MIKFLIPFYVIVFNLALGMAQKTIPLDTVHWDIRARSYVLEPYKGQEAIYLQDGSMTLKDVSFLNGTIEYDIQLKDTRGFPGIYFRSNGSDAEQFYIRPHQSGNPDANQVAPVTKGISPWQFYFGPKYSFPYNYNFDDWTHVKIVVNDNRAQLYLDKAETPSHSWELFHEARAGGVSLSGGRGSGLHIANISIDTETYAIKDFKPGVREPIPGVISEWEISDKFEEKLLKDVENLQSVIDDRKWDNKIQVEEGVAANISRAVQLVDEEPGNTVFAKLTITSDKDQSKLFNFGYSDRVVVVLNGKPVYRGTNKFRTRDYRYLGTIGLFDAAYLNLKKGKNTLLLAISEDFGGWLVTGQFNDQKGLKIE